MIRGAIQSLYLAAGVVVAYTHAYLSVSDWQTAVSALGAILLWPLPLMGVSLHLGTML
jgi:hypothetical protein